jgi:hypothetical protein
VASEFENCFDIELFETGIMELELRNGDLLVQTRHVFFVGLAVDRLLVDEGLVEPLFSRA